MNSQEISMLYYYLDSIFGCPTDIDNISKMTLNIIEERKLSSDFLSSIIYIEAIAKKALNKGYSDIKSFYDYLSKKAREDNDLLFTEPQKEAREAMKRSTNYQHC